MALNPYNVEELLLLNNHHYIRLDLRLTCWLAQPTFQYVEETGETNKISFPIPFTTINIPKVCQSE